MTSYLIVISVGPVQDFIVAARRTRDLWFGSHLLSEISKATSKAVADGGGALIFPSPEKLADLEPSEEMDAFNVANIILAELKDGINPETIEVDARKAAQSRWRGFAEGALKKANRIDSSFIRSGIWKEQVDDVIDFYSAWVPLDSNYAIAHQRLMRLFSGRKAMRDFLPAKGHRGIPKSSLDGARESVLTDDKAVRQKSAQQLRLLEGEQLCSVGLTKRLGGEIVAFPSVSRIALDPWLRGAMTNGKARQLLGEITDLCRGENGFSSPTRKDQYKDFPFDGQVLYQSRLNRLMDRSRLNQTDSYEDNPSENDLKQLDKIKIKVETLKKKENGGLGMGEPDPYLAILVADGDHMGKAISAIKSSDDHRKFSRLLARFASDARKIVEKDCRGCLVYSGGDDVLALLPVDMCLKAARDLHDTFGELLNAYFVEKGASPTLSVGIAIGHFIEPLEDLLEYGRAAEKAAKGTDRNGLAVHLHTRSGGNPVRIQAQWKTEAKDCLDKRLQTWSEMHLLDKLPDKAAYDLYQLARDYQNWPDVSKELLVGDVKRLLKRKRAGHGVREISATDLIELMRGIDSSESLISRADELILAGKIAEVMKQTARPDQVRGMEA